MSWNPRLHPRDGENGRFTRNWEARLADQLTAGRRRGEISSSYLPETGRAGSGQPYAKQLGYVRVGEHPTRMGAVGGQESYFGSTTHPDAGGVWVDPARPGTERAPIFRNDYGSPISALRPPDARSKLHKRDRADPRREDYAGTPQDRERRGQDEGGKIGRRLEGAPEAAVKEMRRAQARARVEGSHRVPVRRTPRGTQVESWMDKVNERFEKGARRG